MIMSETETFAGPSQRPNRVNRQFLAPPALDVAAGRVHVNRMQIYKIFTADQWADMQANGQTLGAPIDLADGYIHFSTATQVAETAAKHFAGVKDLVLTAVETAGFGDDIRWEISRGGAKFPHLYRALRMDDVIWTQAYPWENRRHILPEGVT